MQVQMKSEFQQMKLLRAKDDPDPWITKVESLRRRLWSLEVTISETSHLKQHTKGVCNHNRDL